ncbi:MAG: hypothetical protein Q8M76_13000, partial [Spirochaetaceae bacterium]|nr:hypothetical protein [Spirochaetaceae bacterium]
MRSEKIICAIAALAAAAVSAAAQPAISFEAELGAVKVLSHTYRAGAQPANSEFDYVSQGGQEILFPFQRLSATAALGPHQLRFLYQPLEVSTKSTFRSAVTIDGTTFAAGTPVDMKYGFPFYRATYLYEALRGGGSYLAAGAALQIRNASISFASADGEQLALSQNLGLVPALAVSGRLELGGGIFALFDATGIYASSALINGADFEFEGSLLDASLRIGAPIGAPIRDAGSEAFLAARFLGGSAAGVSRYE